MLLNGTSRNGLAKSVGQALTARGFVVTEAATAPAALPGPSRVVWGPGGRAGGARCWPSTSPARRSVARPARGRRVGARSPSAATSSGWPTPVATTGQSQRQRRPPCVSMPRDAPVTDRLSPLDVSFLYMETPTTAMHVGGVAIFEPPPAGLRLRPAGRADQPADRPGAALPAEGQVGPRPAGQPGLGRRPRVRRRPTTCAGPRCPSRATASSSRTWSAGCRAGSSTATGRCGRSTSSRASRTARSRVITKTHHAMVDGCRAIDIGTVMLDLEPTPRELPEDDWSPRKEPGAVDLRRRRRHRPGRPGPPTRSTRSGRPSVTPRPPRARPPSVAGGVLAQAKLMARQAPDSPAQRADRRAAAVRHGRDRPRRLQARPQDPRRHGQRRRARHRQRCAAHLAAHPRREGQPDHGGARDGAGQRARQRREGRAAATGSRPTSSTCRSARAARSCGCTRSPSRCAGTRRAARPSAPTPWSSCPGSPRRRSTRSARAPPAS